MGIEKQVISCRLDEETIKKLENLADKENRTMSNLIETILKTYLKQNTLQ